MNRKGQAFPIERRALLKHAGLAAAGFAVMPLTACEASNKLLQGSTGGSNALAIPPLQAGRIEQDIVVEMSRSGSDAMDLLLERGRAATLAGDFSSAIGHLTALVDHAPEFPEAYNARATAYFMAGLYGPALKDIGTVLTREPRHFGALSGLAVILEETGDEAVALEVLYKIREIHPQMEGLSARIAALELALGGTAL